MGLFAPDTLAIDIGSYSVKGVVIAANKELKKFVTVPTPPGAIEGGVIRNPEQVSEAIQRVWKGLGVKQTNLIASVPGQHVFVRPITLPAMKKKELDQAVRFQAEGQIPIPPTDLVVDYSVIGERREPKQIEILIVATRKSVVQQLVHLFNQAKLQPRVFDLEALALARIVFNSKQKTGAGVDLIASIGAANTHLCIFDGDIPRFTRSIPFGGQRFTRALAMERSISLDEAEERKLNGDMPEEAGTLMDDLAGELKRSIDFFQSQNKEHTVQQVILAGGGAQTAKIEDYLASRLQLPVNFGALGDKVKIPKRLALPHNLEAFRTAFAPVLGLGVRGLK